MKTSWASYKFFDFICQENILILCFSFVKESLNWMLQNEQYERVQVLLRHIGKINSKPFSDFDVASLLKDDAKKQVSVYNFRRILSLEGQKLPQNFDA